MTADYTIEATPGQVAAYELDGFLVVAGPTTECICGGDSPPRSDCPGAAPVPTTKRCPENCLASGGVHVECDRRPCPTCNNDGTVPIVVEVVVPRPHEVNGWVSEGHTRWHRRYSCAGPNPIARSWRMASAVGVDPCKVCNPGGLDSLSAARTLLRGTAEAVPVVDGDRDDARGDPEWIEHGEHIEATLDVVLFWPEGWAQSSPKRVTHHFADVPRPEVGDTAWIIRGEG